MLPPLLEEVRVAACDANDVSERGILWKASTEEDNGKSSSRDTVEGDDQPSQVLLSEVLDLIKSKGRWMLRRLDKVTARSVRGDETEPLAALYSGCHLAVCRCEATSVKDGERVSRRQLSASLIRMS